MDKRNLAGYSADTEVLTRGQGWVTFDQLTHFDEIATRSPDGTFGWRHPGRLDARFHDGEMIRFSRGRGGVDLLVAPGQPVLWTREGGSRGREITGIAGEVERSARTVCLVAMSKYDAPDLERKTFRAALRAAHGPAAREISMTGDQFAAFMGMWISEGSTTSTPRDWLTNISQSRNGKGYDEYLESLTECFGRVPTYNGNSWVFHSRALYDCLAPLGKAVTKRIPREVLDLSPRQLRIFWRYYFLGDGNWAKTQQVAATASKEMAGHLQEIIQKLGFWANAREILCKGNAKVPGERLIYKLGMRQAPYPQASASRVPYSGFTYTASVGDGSVFVRRNGRAVWSAG